MNAKLDKRIHDAIKENLPQQVGETLQKELAKIPEYEKELILLTNKTNDQDKRILKMEGMLSDKDKQISKFYNLEAKGTELKEKEFALKVEKLEYQLEAEKSKTIHANAIALGLVRNVEYRTHTLGSQGGGGIGIVDGQGYHHYPTPEHVDKTETKGAE